MRLERDTISEFDPHGFRRMVARFLDLSNPDSRKDAERLIAARLGPYQLDGGMVNEEIDSYFATRH